MSKFIGEDFMLENDAARELYHEHAARMPIIDYHCHLVPQMIAENRRFGNITEAWLGGDHYKWRAMRANGVEEAYITGDKSDWEKFEKWAGTLPYAMRNPLYHWTHLELARIFGIDEVLSPRTAREIYEACNARLAEPGFRAQGLMTRCNVEVVCTTDDPVDSLEYHRCIAESGFGTKVLPAWRPDKATAVSDPEAYNAYLDRLEAAADMSIGTYEELLDALHVRHDFFDRMGCRLSDHGLGGFVAADYTESDLMQIFAKVRGGTALTAGETAKFQSGLLFDLALMDDESGWTQQYHVGAIRNNNSRMFDRLGPDAGYDSIGEEPCAAAGNRFLDRLARAGKLSKTILYNLHPKDTEVLITMAGNFNEGPTVGKVQYGAAWWFLDQEDGMTKQLNALSSLGLLGRFVGMLTDSRSFLSYPRHEYFRRILCDVIGADIESGRLPRSETAFIGQLVEDICYGNAERYFGFFENDDKRQ